MKIPLEQEPFPPVTLSRDQELQLKWLSDTILDETLVEHDDFVYQCNRVLDRTKWKHVMSRENVSIYKRVGKGELGGCTPDISLHLQRLEPSTIYWRVPSCVGVGTLPGSLDDLLYGALAPTKTATDVRTTYIKDEAADSRVIVNVINPSESDPLRYLLVRWSLLFQLVNRIAVTPRDVVNMESAGARVLPNGERIGYLVLQSVDLPGCGELKRFGVIRSKFSSCFIFRDTGHGTIELFMRAFVEPCGRLGDGLAVFSASMSLIASWRFMYACTNKKLAFMIRTSLATKSRRDLFTKAREDNSRSCPVCLKNLSMLRSTRCDLCMLRICSRCGEKRKITHVKSTGDLTRVSTRVCKGCMETACKMSASDIAAAEYVPDSNRWLRLGSQDSTLSSGSSSRRSPNFGVWSHRHSSDFRQHSDTITSYSTTAGNDSHNRGHGSDASGSCLTEVDYSFPSPSNIRDSQSSIIPLSEDAEAALTVDQDQLDLLIRINQLRVAAEEAYVLTMRNTDAMLEARPSFPTPRGGGVCSRADDVEN